MLESINYTLYSVYTILGFHKHILFTCGFLKKSDIQHNAMDLVKFYTIVNIHAASTKNTHYAR